MEDEELLSFKKSEFWRRWLVRNHDGVNAVWLIISKKNSREAGISYTEALEEALCFGWIDGKMQSIDDDKFRLRFSPRKAKSVWSKLNKDRALKLIESGRMTDAGMTRIAEAKKNGMWDKAYTNRRKEEMIPDLEDALKKEPEAWNNFQAFANSYRNMYIGWVNDAKTEQTRKKRIREVVERSLKNIKPGM